MLDENADLETLFLNGDFYRNSWKDWWKSEEILKNVNSAKVKGAKVM